MHFGNMRRKWGQLVVIAAMTSGPGRMQTMQSKHPNPFHVVQPVLNPAGSVRGMYCMRGRLLLASVKRPSCKVIQIQLHARYCQSCWSLPFSKGEQSRHLVACTTTTDSKHLPPEGDGHLLDWARLFRHLLRVQSG